MTKQKWPDEISDEKNAEFLKKIETSFIEEASFRRNDPYYEHAVDRWELKLVLNVGGDTVRAYTSDKKLIEKFGEEPRKLASTTSFMQKSGATERLAALALEGFILLMAIITIQTRKMTSPALADCSNRQKIAKISAIATADSAMTHIRIKRRFSKMTTRRIFLPTPTRGR